MPKQVKVIIAIICIGLGLFWNQIPDLINRIDTPNTSVSITEPTPELQETVKGIPTLVTGDDAAKDKDPNSGWVHCSFNEQNNRKQVLTFDGKTYTNGLPEAKWSGGQFAN